LYERVLALRGLEKSKKEGEKEGGKEGEKKAEKEVEKDLKGEEEAVDSALSLDDMLASVVNNQDRFNIYVCYYVNLYIQT
jgi:hypothetical protein